MTQEGRFLPANILLDSSAQGSTEEKVHASIPIPKMTTKMTVKSYV
jgi:hypothetical protein